MAVGERRGSRPPAAAAVDDLLPMVAQGDVAAFAACCDQISGAVYGLVRRIVLACCGCSWREMADLAQVPAVTVAERLRDGLRGLTSV
jgi:hypothetical protein